MTRSQKKKKTVNSNEVTVNSNENSLILDIVNMPSISGKKKARQEKQLNHFE